MSSILKKTNILLIPGKYNEIQDICFKIKAIVDRMNLNLELNRIPSLEEDIVFYSTLIPELKKKIINKISKNKNNKNDNNNLSINLIPKMLATEWIEKNSKKCGDFIKIFNKDKIVKKIDRKILNILSSNSSSS